MQADPLKSIKGELLLPNTTHQKLIFFAKMIQCKVFEGLSDTLTPPSKEPFDTSTSHCDLATSVPPRLEEVTKLDA